MVTASKRAAPKKEAQKKQQAMRRFVAGWYAWTVWWCGSGVASHLGCLGANAQQRRRRTERRVAQVPRRATAAAA
eukprot:2259527-Prymnesium_polylepis.1